MKTERPDKLDELNTFRAGGALFCLTLLVGCASMDGGALIGALAQTVGGTAAGMGERGGNSAAAA